MNTRKGIFILASVLAAAWLLRLFDNGIEVGWPSIVLNNWHEFGLFKLHGALVINHGGFEATTHPVIYYGMSPWYLYPVYICNELFQWTGLGTLPYHIVLAALVLWSIWNLLGKNNLALMVAVLVIVSPGYGRWQKLLDPNALSVLLGLPYAAVVTSLLKEPRLRPSHQIILFILTAMFVPLNWSTAWFLAPFGVFLLLNPEVRWRPAVVYLTLTAIGAMVFVGFSMVAKHAGAVPDASTIAVSAKATPGRFLGGYTWGNYGYYEGLSSFRFFFRLFMVNIIGLLPLILWWGFATVAGIRNSCKQGIISLMPALTALLAPIAMRNYFCHHPWMGAPVVIAGLVLSMALLPKDESMRQTFANLKWPATAAAIAFAYGFIVIAGFRANSKESMSLIELVRSHVPRNDTIVVVRTLDPETATLTSSLGETLGEVLDRQMMTAETMNAAPKDVPAMILSSHPTDALPLVAEADATSTGGIMTKAVTWFGKNIARRKADDKIEYQSHYYLYRLSPDTPAHD